MIYNHGTSFYQMHVFRISENAVAKVSEFIRLSEARSMQLVAARTSVRVPRVIHTFEVPINEDSKKTYIVMQYICGELLMDCWADMSEEQRENVCDQVAAAIGELQAIELQQPGPIGGGRSEGSWFTINGAAPFESVRQLEDWFSHRLYMCKRVDRVDQDMPSFVGRFGNKLVMSHMDISTRNIILEEGDKICLIDWECAGAYPVQFERAALAVEQRDRDFCERILSRIDSFAEEVKRMMAIRWAIVCVH